MKTGWIVTGSLVALLAVVPSAGVRAQGVLAPVPVRLALRANRREPHPALRQALRALQQARVALQNADRDFGGHRAHAVDLTDQAIREVQAAIQYDRR
jgi:endonuclease/exonuclease/phosphatase family metal-dependent hydrolase